MSESTPIYLQIGEGRRFRIGHFVESGEMSFADLLRAVAGSVEPPEAGPKALRWFTDDDGQDWRENPDGTLTLVHVFDDGDYIDSGVSQGCDMVYVEAWHGPLTECEAPRADDH